MSVSILWGVDVCRHAMGSLCLSPCYGEPMSVTMLCGVYNMSSLMDIRSCTCHLTLSLASLIK